MQIHSHALSGVHHPTHGSSGDSESMGLEALTVGRCTFAATQAEQLNAVGIGPDCSEFRRGRPNPRSARRGRRPSAAPAPTVLTDRTPCGSTLPVFCDQHDDTHLERLTREIFADAIADLIAIWNYIWARVDDD